MPSPTPLFFRSKTVFVPPANVPASTCLIVSYTDVSTRFSALVSTCGPRYDWSASTPIPHTFFSFAASSTPRPQPPATWNTMSAPAAIWLSAACLHLAWSTQSCEYAFSSFTPGSALRAPA